MKHMDISFRVWQGRIMVSTSLAKTSESAILQTDNPLSYMNDTYLQRYHTIHLGFNGFIFSNWKQGSFPRETRNTLKYFLFLCFFINQGLGETSYFVFKGFGRYCRTYIFPCLSNISLTAWFLDSWFRRCLHVFSFFLYGIYSTVKILRVEFYTNIYVLSNLLHPYTHLKPESLCLSLRTQVSLPTE